MPLGHRRILTSWAVVGVVEDVQRVAMSFKSKPWLVHITPVPLGTRPPAEILSGELIVRRQAQ